MNLFTCTLPKKISRDKDNKKWFVRYSITYNGEKTEYPKEYSENSPRNFNKSPIRLLW
ncbi:hypothetical protein ABIC74_001369 [Mucilaginibacter rubeus]|nr:hypothetical protein SAMN03159284_02528 [Mucilaginibacter sp. NFR10]